MPPTSADADSSAVAWVAGGVTMNETVRTSSTASVANGRSAGSTCQPAGAANRTTPLSAGRCVVATTVTWRGVPGLNRLTSNGNASDTGAITSMRRPPSLPRGSSVMVIDWPATSKVYVTGIAGGFSGRPISSGSVTAYVPMAGGSASQ